MRLRYDEDFVEAVVLGAAGAGQRNIPALQISRFHRHRERLYTILDPDERNAAFFKLHLEWFREWGLEQRLIGPLRHFPLLATGLAALAVRQARGRDDEGSELYVNEQGVRTGVLAMRPERLIRDLELPTFLRHELTHLNDMLAPAFGYRPELAGAGEFLGSQRLARERYRLLWDVTIDGRAARDGHPTLATREQRWVAFIRGFPFWDDTQQREIFDSLWSDPRPTHARLEELVRDPRQLLRAGPGPGSPCPLCGFPSFAWAEAASLADETLKAIQAEFPAWSPRRGVCRRCAEIYRRGSPAVAGESVRRHNEVQPSLP